jgi:elongation factor 3
MLAATATASTIPAPASLKGPVDGQVNVAALFVADKAIRDAATKVLASAVQNDGPAAIAAVGFVAVKALAYKKSAAVHGGAADAVVTLSRAGATKALKPTFINSGLYAALIEGFADKMPAPHNVAASR